MSRSVFFSRLLSFVLIIGVSLSISDAARPPIAPDSKPSKPVAKRIFRASGVTRAQLKKALADARAAKSTFLASKKRAKLLVATAKTPGATKADKKAALQAVAAVRRDAKWLKAAIAKLKIWRSRLLVAKKMTVKPVGKKRAVATKKASGKTKTVTAKKTVGKKGDVITKKARGKNVAVAAKKAARKTVSAVTKENGSKLTKVAGKKPTRKSAPVVLKKRTIPMVKNAVDTMSKKVVKLNGRKLPMNCYCARQRAGESKCYFFTKGGYCSVRFCAPSYACVGRRRSRGTLCLLRRIRSRIVPVRVRDNKCRIQRINSYMYVPYARY